MFRRYRAGLRNFAGSIVYNSSDAEEIVNDVFLSIWDKREVLVLDDTLKNYLFTSVKNRCLNHLKKAKLPFSEMPEDFSAPSIDASTLEKIEGFEAEKKITFLINQLPPKCKQVFLLSRMQELSYKEIAEVMDISPKTVENQIGLALKFLKDAMGLRNTL